MCCISFHFLIGLLAKTANILGNCDMNKQLHTAKQQFLCPTEGEWLNTTMTPLINQQPAIVYFTFSIPSALTKLDGKNDPTHIRGQLSLVEYANLRYNSWGGSVISTIASQQEGPGSNPV